jgi:hypothetical protein
MVRKSEGTKFGTKLILVGQEGQKDFRTHSPHGTQYTADDTQPTRTTKFIILRT